MHIIYIYIYIYTYIYILICLFIYWFIYLLICINTINSFWWMRGPTTRLLLVLHCGCPVFTFCGLCTCGCHPFQQYSAVVCLLAFSESLICQIKLFPQIFPMPGPKVTSIGKLLECGKRNDLPGLVGDVFPLPSSFRHCPGGHVHHPLK